MRLVLSVSKIVYLVDNIENNVNYLISNIAK